MYTMSSENDARPGNPEANSEVHERVRVAEEATTSRTEPTETPPNTPASNTSHQPPSQPPSPLNGAHRVSGTSATTKGLSRSAKNQAAKTASGLAAPVSEWVRVPLRGLGKNSGPPQRSMPSESIAAANAIRTSITKHGLRGGHSSSGREEPRFSRTSMTKHGLRGSQPPNRDHGLRGSHSSNSGEGPHARTSIAKYGLSSGNRPPNRVQGLRGSDSSYGGEGPLVVDDSANVLPRNSHEERLDDEENTASNLTAVLPAITGPTEELARARLIPEDSVPILPIAEPFDVMQDSASRKQVETKFRRKTYFAGPLVVAAIVVVVGVTVGVVVSRQSDDNPLPTATPSTLIPSVSPTTPPTNSPLLAISTLPDYTQASLEDPLSPQSFAYEWVIQHPNITFFPEWKKLQLFGLATIYHSLDGDNWPEVIRKDWLDYEKDECYWYSSLIGSFNEQGEYQLTGLGNWTCHPELVIQAIALSGVNFTGLNTITLPREISLLPLLHAIFMDNNNIAAPFHEFLPQEIFHLQNLTILHISNSSLTGTIPSAIGLMSNLQSLSIHNSWLSGPLPTEIGLLTNLSFFDFSMNSVQGTLPTELGLLKNIASLFGDSNLCSGQIPTEIGILSNLRTLALGSNRLTGPIPSELGKIFKDTKTDTEAEFVGLSGNLLTGNIPSEVGLLSRMGLIDFSSNGLSGTIPIELGGLTKATRLYLGWNGLLSGTVPTELGLLSHLVGLTLTNNALNGTVPSELGLLSNLAIVGLSFNTLGGSLPTELGNLRNLTLLSIMYSNELFGWIPSELGLLHNLEWLVMQGNKFSGALPTELLAELTALKYLDLASNALTGTIPTALGLPALEFMSLIGNSFTGGIPSEIGMLQSLSSLYLIENPSLGGNIPSEIGLLSNLQELWLVNCGLTGALPTELTRFPPFFYFNASKNPELTGVVSDSFCTLQNDTCSYIINYSGEEFPCTLGFDCLGGGGKLCGCDCSCTNQTNANPSSPN